MTFPEKIALTASASMFALIMVLAVPLYIVAIVAIQGQGEPQEITITQPATYPRVVAPIDNTGSIGAEVRSEPRYPINPQALTEPKTQSRDCDDCPAPIPLSSSAAPIPIPDPAPNALEQIKHGAYTCERCKKPMVGDQQATDWLSDGTPVTFLCVSCYEKTKPSEKKTLLEKWLADQKIQLPADRAAEYRAAIGAY